MRKSLTASEVRKKIVEGEEVFKRLQQVRTEKFREEIDSIITELVDSRMKLGDFNVVFCDVLLLNYKKDYKIIPDIIHGLEADGFTVELINMSHINTKSQNFMEGS